MRQPSIIRLTKFFLHDINNVQAYTKEGYVPARPYGLASRWKAAWLVLCGKADALVWPGGQ